MQKRRIAELECQSVGQTQSDVVGDKLLVDKIHKKEINKGPIASKSATGPAQQTKRNPARKSPTSTHRKSPVHRKKTPVGSKVLTDDRDSKPPSPEYSPKVN